MFVITLTSIAGVDFPIEPLLVFYGVFKIPRLCEPPEDPTRVEGHIREGIANIILAIPVSVMTTISNRLTQCIDKG